MNTADSGCTYIISEDRKESDKQSLQDWLKTLVSDKPKVKCKSKGDCDICGNCVEHCVKHYGLRTHLDKFYKPTKWNSLGKAAKSQENE